MGDLEAGPEALISAEDGISYWNGIDADVNGMLGGLPNAGYGAISQIDLRGSRTFLSKLGVRTRGRVKLGLALEGGAGIGRVTEGLLLDVANEVDVIEPVAKFTASLEKKPGVRTIFNVGLQDWHPREGGGAYDLVWVQWCAGHLGDGQLVAFLARCRAALAPGTGVIVFKENMSQHDVDDFDPVDSAVTRTNKSFLRLFALAGLRVIRTELQRGFPAELLAVRSYALMPADG